jgi:hypothetical protein
VSDIAPGESWGVATPHIVASLSLAALKNHQTNDFVVAGAGTPAELIANTQLKLQLKRSSSESNGY